MWVISQLAWVLWAQIDPFSFTEVGKFVSQVGLSVALVVYLVWENSNREKRREGESSKREARYQEKVDQLELFMRTELMSLTRQTMQALNNDAIQTAKTGDALDNLSKVIDRKMT